MKLTCTKLAKFQVEPHHLGKDTKRTVDESQKQTFIGLVPFLGWEIWKSTGKIKEYSGIFTLA